MSPANPIPLTQPAARVLKRFGNNYYLVQKLAAGGMAEIFLAKQVGAEGFERDVVIKCMLDHFTDSKQFVDMFLDEARLAAKLFHPNIVQITDLGKADNRYYICMEYLPGEDLQTLIEFAVKNQQPVPVVIATRLILSACEGLEYAHAYAEGGVPVNLVHRDISPSNIIVTFQGQVKVVDFGIAKASSKVVQTQAGTLKGKWGYMSPEQARGENIDNRSDVYSLGVTFYELLTGQRMFARGNELGILLAMLAQEPQPPSKLRPDIPPALDQIILKSLAKDREDRYTSSQLRAELQQFLSQTYSVPGMSQIAEYMETVFGREHVQQKTRVPTLQELGAMGLTLDTTTPQDEALGSDKTFVRDAPALTPVAMAAPPQPERGKGFYLLAVLVFLVIAVGGSTGAFLFRPELRAIVQPYLPKATPAAQVAPAPRAPTAPELPPDETQAPAAIAPTPIDDKTETVAPKTRVEGAPVKLELRHIYAVFKKKNQAIAGCVEASRGDLPPSGKILLRFQVSRSGTVADAGLDVPGLAEKPLGKCLLGTVRKLKFPKNVDEPTVELPLDFQVR